ncbi:hypothetical protein XPA_002041 [Xanthoria parietina]
MRYTALATTICCFLTVLGGAHAGFTLKDDKKWYGTGCSLALDNVCGCTKKLNINHAYACHELPSVYTHGSVCGGHWTLEVAKNKRHGVKFSRGGCSRVCDIGDLEHNAHCD